jgi:hypothetical protein
MPRNTFSVMTWLDGAQSRPPCSAIVLRLESCSKDSWQNSSTSPSSCRHVARRPEHVGLPQTAQRHVGVVVLEPKMGPDKIESARAARRDLARRHAVRLLLDNQAREQRQHHDGRAVPPRISPSFLRPRRTGTPCRGGLSAARNRPHHHCATAARQSLRRAVRPDGGASAIRVAEDPDQPVLVGALSPRPGQSMAAPIDGRHLQHRGSGTAGPLQTECEPRSRPRLRVGRATCSDELRPAQKCKPVRATSPA